MTFWQHIVELRKKNKIPKQWRIKHIRPHLLEICPDGRYRENAIRTIPFNQSITKDGKAKGDYVKRGRPAEAFRVGKGLFELIDDPA